MYSLTGSRNLTDKIALLRELGIAPEVVFDTEADDDEAAIRRAAGLARSFPQRGVIHLVFRSPGESRPLDVTALLRIVAHALDAGSSSSSSSY